MDKRVSFAFKRCGFKSGSIFFFFLFNLSVCSSFSLIYVDMDVFI